ncbi:non-ribosomal peptide synthetase [Posidoniimonas polymericola]|uniref:non-ribosomal peptide synthetase n=1 Tax=Posidoniimonas polymericola TaxID=2528002 RepID=UPI0018D3FC41|nr:non-ribosomal peptide synthetase [Posidoniimonas polymericola]
MRAPQGATHWGLSTLVEVAQWRAQNQAKESAYTFLSGDAEQPATFSYGGLERRARAIAAELQQRGPVGQRVLVVLEPGLDYIATLFGCFFAGAVAVPVYPPDPFRIARTLPRLQAIFKNAECQLLVSSRQWVGSETSLLRQTCPAGAIAIEDLADDAADAWRPFNPAASDLALLQYTSGTTGSPRGVAITYANLQYNLRAMEQLLDVPDAVATFWLPPYHDLGLIGGVFLPLFAGRRTVLMSPLDFVRRPVSWLQTISEYGATTSAAPNFGYELCARKIADEDCEGLDLSSWQVAVSGAEPVRSETLDRFCERFEPYGFRREAFVPAYGMAETTLMVSVGPLTKPPLEREYKARDMAESAVVPRNGKAEPIRRLVGCGPPGPEIDLRIVDPQTRRPTDGVGEIWVRSPGVAAGYWRNPEQTSTAFDAVLSTGEQGFLRTGDLGFLDAGELFVVGRRKETVILGGRNYYPQDIELAIQQRHEAFKADGGAVASLDLEGEERLVVFHEVQRPKRQDLPALCDIVRSVVLEETLQEPHAVVLLPVGELPKTSSGKTRRSQCWPEYESRILTAVYAWEAGQGDKQESVAVTSNAPPATPTESWLSELWQELLDVESVSREDSFFALGGQSLQIIQLLQDVAAKTGKTIAASELFAHSTLAGFAAVVDQASENAARGFQKASPAFLAQPQPLTEPQQRMWMLEQLGLPGGANVPMVLELNGPLDRERLAAALGELVERRQMLRTSFTTVDGEPRQTLHTTAELLLEEIAPPAQPPAIPVDWASNLDFVWRPFELDAAPLARAGVAPLAPDRHLLVLVMHHLICDGVAFEPLTQELAALYSGGDLPAGRFDYWDYLANQDRPSPSGGNAEYWAGRLADAPSAINLPLVTGQAATDPRSIERHTLSLSAEQTAAVTRLATRCSATPFAVYLSALQVLLGRFSGDNEVVVGVAQAGRDAAEARDTLGCFMHAAPILARVGGDQTYDEFLAELRDNVLADLAHAGVPWEQILAAANADRVPGRMPLTQVFFLFESPLSSRPDFDGARIVNAATDYRGLGVYDLTVVVDASGRGADVRLLYDPQLLPSEFVERLAEGYRQLLDSVCAAPAATLSRLEVVSPEQRRKLITAGKGRTDDAPAEHLLASFARHAAYSPAAVAVECSGDAQTYGQLSTRADEITAGLAALGVRRGDRVGLLLTRGVDTLATMLGVWKVGAAYVPLDPSYPPARLGRMVEDCTPALLIADHELAADAPGGAGKVVTLPELLAAGAGKPALRREPQAADAAYVIYTSGSTGNPKGVVVPHRAVANFVRSFGRDLSIVPADRVLAATTISFDISVLELFLPLAAGATVVLADSATVGDGGRLGRLINDANVTLVQGTPSTYRMLLATGWRPTSRQRLLAGGEELTPDLARELAADAGRLWNVYGPTETTIWSTIDEIADVGERVSIGRPIDNTQCYLLDSRQRLVPPGGWGELAIGGAGLADGYYEQEELTAARFPTIELNGGPTRVYLTGDLVRWRSDGRLEFGGRADTQVKVRGHRIELGEIERNLCEHPGVAEAAVVTVDDPLGAALAAYFVDAGGSELSPAELRRWLAESLPEYMLPSAFVSIDEALPRNGSGKLDRKRLPKPEGCLLARSAERVAPSTPLEERLAGWWREVLRLEEVGVHENFFELGGHSLSVMQLTVRIHEHLGVELDLREVYRLPTIAHWAELILAQQVVDADLTEPELLAQIEAMSDEEAVAFLEGLGTGD